mgnify:CR=1 FL=1
MIDLVFLKNKEFIGIKITGKFIQFCKIEKGYYVYAPIDGLQLDINGILKEYPDLKGLDNLSIKKEAIKRFKEKIRSFDTEEQIMAYLKNDLRKHNYNFIGYHKKGFRFVKEHEQPN